MPKAKREYSKEESKFIHPLPNGWLRPYLLGLDEMFIKRWGGWLDVLSTRKWKEFEIPQIQFSTPHKEAMSNLEKTISCAYGLSRYTAWIGFVRWLLWGFGWNRVKEFPRDIDEKISWEWYRIFNMGLMMKYPADYMAWGAQEVANISAAGFFSTPIDVCNMMVKMTVDPDNKEDNRDKTVCDPCMGTGSMLLSASNYSLRLYGQDINNDMAEMTAVNGFLYVPWLIAPLDDKYYSSKKLLYLKKNDGKFKKVLLPIKGRRFIS